MVSENHAHRRRAVARAAASRGPVGLAAGASIASIASIAIVGIASFASIIGIGGIGGCGSSLQGSSGALRAGKPALAATLARERLDSNRKDWTSWRDLGIAMYLMDHPSEALGPLDWALLIHPADRPSAFFRGRVLDRLGMFPRAVDAYVEYTAMTAGPGREVAQSRIDQLRIAIENESPPAAPGDSSEAGRLAERTVAIPDFATPSDSASLRPIARGLAAMTRFDLSQVPTLHVIGRARMGILPSSIPSDPAEMKDLGRRLGAGWIVQGIVIPAGDRRIQIDADIGSTLMGTSLRSIASMTVPDTELVAAQQRLVSKILEVIGIARDDSLERRLAGGATKDNETFLAFCRGIDLERRGMIQDALVQLGNAIQRDPGFILARRAMAALSFGPAEFPSIERMEIAGLTPNPVDLGSRSLATNRRVGLRPIVEDPPDLETATPAGLRDPFFP